MPDFRRFIALFVATGLLPAVAVGQPLAPLQQPQQQADEPPTVYLTTSMEARNRLNVVDAFVKQSEWAEAIEILQTLIDTLGDKVVPTQAQGADLFVALRTYCHNRIAGLPEAAIRLYRSRFDPQVAELLKQAEQTGDLAPLRKIVDGYFCATGADRALEKLGDRSLTLGRFDDAAMYWAKLLPLEATGHAKTPNVVALRYPDPKVDVPRIAAKWIAARLLAGDVSAARRATEWLHAKHPDAGGRIAGKSGSYWKTVEELAAAPDFKPAPADRNWATFAGDSRRGRMLGAAVDVGGAQFQWDLDSEGEGRRERSEDREFGESKLPYHPIVFDGQAFVATESRIWRFDLNTGTQTSWQELGATRNRDNDSARPRHTLTIHGRKLFVCTHETRNNGGFEGQRRFRRMQQNNMSGSLYCYDLATQKELWKLAASDVVAERNAVFEGAPIAAGGFVYVALTRYDAMCETSIVCLDAETRRLIWRTGVCESSNEGQSGPVPLFNLLTMADSSIYYCTNLGAVAAVNAEDGRIRWASTYQRRPGNTFGMAEPTPRDLNPCVYHRGLVYAAPRDGDRILCFDADTGRKVWESVAGLGVVHLLGVSKGNLVATGGQVFGLDAQTGKVRWKAPENRVPGNGRGLLAENSIYWPTRTEIHVFDPENGSRMRPPIELLSRYNQKTGNLVMSNGYLLVAQGNRLVALCSYQKLLQKYKDAVVERPAAADPHFQLAELAARHDDWKTAASHFGEALNRANLEHVVDGRPMRKAAAEGRFEALLNAAKNAVGADAEHAFDGAVQAAPSAKAKLVAIRAEVERSSAARAAALCQRILDDPTLRSESAGEGLRGGAWAARRLQAIFAKDGRQAYARFDAEAAKLATEHRGGSLDALVELAERFPVSTALGDVLLETATVQLKRGDAVGARKVLRRMLRDLELPGGPTSVRARAVALLADVHHRTGDVAEIYVRAAQAREDLAAWPDAVRDVSPFSITPDSGRSASFRLHPQNSRDELRFEPRAGGGSAGSLSWASVRVETAAPPVWAGQSYAGLLVVAGGEVCCHDAAGKVVWRQRIDSNAAPWAGSAVLGAAGSFSLGTTSPSASRFAVAGDHLLVADRGRLTAYSVDDGAVGWRQEWPCTEDEPQPLLVLAGATAWVARTYNGMAFDPFSGKRVLELPLNGGVAGVQPVSAGGRLVVALDRTAVAAFDERTGAESWRLAVVSPALALPRFIAVPGAGDAARILVCLDGSQLLCLKARSGEELWNTAVSDRPSVDFARQVQVAAGGIEIRRGDVLERRSMETGDVVGAGSR